MVGSERRPHRRSLALLKFADAVEAAGDDLMTAESKNCGKPYDLHREEEVGPMVDQLRFLLEPLVISRVKRQANTWMT